MKTNHPNNFKDMLSDIPTSSPRPVSLLKGLSYKGVMDKSSFLPLFFIVPFFLFVPLMVFSIEKETRLPFIEMRQTDAQVIEIIVSNRCNSCCHELHYSFITSNGRTYSGEQNACEGSVYFNIVKGDTVPVVYDPEEPSFNGIEGIIGKNDSPILFFILFPFLFISILIPLLWPNMKRQYDARKVFKQGIISNGEVVFIKRKGGTSVFNTWAFNKFQIFYRYKSQDGSNIETDMVTENDWIINKLDLGSTVTIAFLESKPQKSIILECYLR